MSRLFVSLIVISNVVSGVILGFSPAIAQNGADFPQRQLTIIVGSPAGAITDSYCRLIAEHLRKAWNQPVIVENAPGAGTIIAMQRISRAPPDGYTIGLGNIASLGISPALKKPGSLPYDADRDFAAITNVATQPILLLSNPNKIPAKSVSELIAYAKENPDKVTFGTPGVGGSTHLAMELLMSATATKMVHVPYPGSPNAARGLVAGDITIASLPTDAWPLVTSGQVRALASFNAERGGFLGSDIPTVSETVSGLELTTWNGLVVPAKTPVDVVAKLSDEIRKYLNSEEAKKAFGYLGGIPVGDTPDHFSQLIKSDLARFRRLGQETGIRID